VRSDAQQGRYSCSFYFCPRGEKFLGCARPGAPRIRIVGSDRGDGQQRPLRRDREPAIVHRTGIGIIPCGRYPMVASNVLNLCQRSLPRFSRAGAQSAVHAANSLPHVELMKSPSKCFVSREHHRCAYRTRTLLVGSGRPGPQTVAPSEIHRQVQVRFAASLPAAFCLHMHIRIAVEPQCFQRRTPV